MNNNWKEEFDNLMDNYLRHFADAVISKRVIESINKEQDNILYSFITSLLAEQKKELIGDLQKALKYVVSVDEVKRLLEESLNHHD